MGETTPVNAMHHQVFMSIDLNVVEVPGPATRKETNAPSVLVGFVSNERAILVLGRLATTYKQSNGKCQSNSNLVHRVFSFLTPLARAETNLEGCA